MKTNCWEVKKCGRQPGGPKETELGVFSAATNFMYNDTNGGKSTGRYCWKVAGALCGGRVQGTFVDKLANCTQCEFFKMVKSEEDAAFRA